MSAEAAAANQAGRIALRPQRRFKAIFFAMLSRRFPVLSLGSKTKARGGGEQPLS
jgi:hypothetical protein